MAFGVVFRSNTAFVIRAHKEIGKQALFAAANVVRNFAIQDTKRGMTTGRYVTPHLSQNIFMEVNVSKGEAYIGTPVKHGLYWEKGHDNIVTGKYERQPWLTRALLTVTKQQKAATKAAERTAKRFGTMGLERLAGMTPIGSLRSTIGR